MRWDSETLLLRAETSPQETHGSPCPMGFECPKGRMYTLRQHKISHWFCSHIPYKNFILFWERFYLFIFREKRKEGEREGDKHRYDRETSVVASHTHPDLGPAVSQACAPLGTEPVTFRFAEWCPANWANFTLFKRWPQRFLSCYFLHLTGTDILKRNLSLCSF